MSAAPAPRPVEDRDSAPWWAAVRDHRLTVQRCGRCGTLRFPPRALCGRCRSRASGWVDVSGRGTVLTWVVTHHTFLPAFADRVPYAVVLVRLAEQVDLVMYGNTVGLKPSEIEPDLPVRASFHDVDPDLTLVYWQPD